MKEKLIKFIPIILLYGILFYILPMIIKDSATAMLVLLVLIPSGTLFFLIYYGLKYGFDLYYIVLVMILFCPTIFIYYNSTATVYVMFFGCIAGIGNVIGKLISKR